MESLWWATICHLQFHTRSQLLQNPCHIIRNLHHQYQHQVVSGPRRHPALLQVKHHVPVPECWIEKCCCTQNADISFMLLWPPLVLFPFFLKVFQLPYLASSCTPEFLVMNLDYFCPSFYSLYLKCCVFLLRLMQLVLSILFFRSYVFATSLYMCNLFPVCNVCFSASLCNHCGIVSLSKFCVSCIPTQWAV